MTSFVELASALKKAVATDSEDLSRAVDVLKLLLPSSPSVGELKATKLGRTAAKLCKHRHAEVAALSARLVKSWKQVVRSALAKKKQQQPQPQQQKQQPQQSGVSGQTGAKPAATSKPKIQIAPSTSTGEASVEKKAPQTPLDPKRAKVQQLLTKALLLKGPDGQESELSASKRHTVGAQLEGALFRAYPQEDDYNDRFRLLYRELKHDLNPALKRAVLGGELAAARLATMQVADFENEQVKSAKEAAAKEAAEAARSDWQPESKGPVADGLYTCGRCRSKKTTFFQMQTRSADEPMTKFITCHGCGNQWKTC